MKQMNVTEKQIGENSFYIKPFSAFLAANISGELVSALSPILSGLAPLVGGTSNPENIMDAEIESMGPALAQAFGDLSGDRVERLMKKLLTDHKNISIEGAITDGNVTLLTYDLANEVFCGEIQDMFILCAHVISLNFSGIFKKLGSTLRDRGAEAESGGVVA